MKISTVIYPLLVLLCLSLLLPPTHILAAAGKDLQVTVEVVKADRASANIDPQLQDMARELGPAFNYTGFSLLKKALLKLKAGTTGDVILAKDRTLTCRFLGYADDQARLEVQILDLGKKTFGTTLLMINGGTVLIGGPQHEDGVLLLRIGAEF